MCTSIVAVHGLGGHPIKNWKKDQYVWLRDALPLHFPQARIMTFGYNGRLSMDAKFDRIGDFADKLLLDLADIRKDVSTPTSDLLPSI
jgi:hypothetical protein